MKSIAPNPIPEFMSSTTVSRRVLTDPPAVVQLKREFARVDEEEQLRQEAIDLRQGDVPAHYVARDAARARKVAITAQLHNLRRWRA